MAPMSLLSLSRQLHTITFFLVKNGRDRHNKNFLSINEPNQALSSLSSPFLTRKNVMVRNGRDRHDKVGKYFLPIICKYVLGCVSILKCARVCASVRECARVCASVRKCARVCVSVCKYF